MQGGHISPMGEIENKLAAMIIQMVCIRYPMTPSSCLQLTNNFISGTEVKKNNIKLKNKYFCMNAKEGNKVLGPYCWNTF